MTFSPWNPRTSAYIVDFHDDVEPDRAIAVLRRLGLSEPRRRFLSGLRMAATPLTERQHDALHDSPETAAVYASGRRSRCRVMTPAEISDLGISGRVDPRTGLADALAALGVSPTGPRSAAGVRVAVLDSGVEVGHPDFPVRMRNARHRNAFARDGQAVVGTDDHGTMCASLIGAVRISAAAPGVQYSVAPGASVLSGRVFPLAFNSAADDVWILNAIEWAVFVRSARVICLSLGGAPQSGLLYERLAQRAMRYRSGCLLIAAAGNSSNRRLGRVSPLEEPASCRSVVAVGAVDTTRTTSPSEPASFSNGGWTPDEEPDVYAPGVGVCHATVDGTLRLATGTSCAAAYAAGVAALWLRKMPGLTARELWSVMRASGGPTVGPARVPLVRCP